MRCARDVLAIPNIGERHDDCKLGLDRLVQGGVVWTGLGWARYFKNKSYCCDYARLISEPI